MKRFLSIILAVSMLLAVCVMPVGAQDAVTMSQMQTKDIITITVDGNYVDCASYGQMPVIVEGRTLVPLRSVFEALGAEVFWDNDTRSVKSVKGDITVVLAVDSKDMAVNGTVKTLDVPAQIMNERTMVPVRAVAEAFGASVSWNNETRTVVITTANTEETPVQVVEKSINAMKAMNFEEMATYFENPDAFLESLNLEASVLGSLANDGDWETIKSVFGPILNLVSFEIADCTINGDKAEVIVNMTAPDFESIDWDSYIDEEVVLLLYSEVLAAYGYTLEDIYTITDEALQQEISDAIMLATTFYMIDVMVEVADEIGTVTETDVTLLTLKNGKWLIVE